MNEKTKLLQTTKNVDSEGVQSMVQQITLPLATPASKTEASDPVPDASLLGSGRQQVLGPLPGIYPGN